MPRTFAGHRKRRAASAAPGGHNIIESSLATARRRRTNICAHSRAQMQTNLASSAKNPETPIVSGFFLFLWQKSDRILFQRFYGKDAVLLCVQKSTFLSRSCIPMFLDDPFARIIFNIFPRFIIILLIADHMIVIGALEQLSA